MDTYLFSTSFYDGDTEIPFHQETGMLFLSKGEGVLWADGTRYRVGDVWLSFDKHGRFDVGFHVFLERVEEGDADDRLQRIAPNYFSHD